MSLDDERVRFYLRHSKQIEEWAALRAETAVAVDEWMESLQPDIERLAQELGADVELRTVIGGENSFPTFRLTRRNWPALPIEDPPVSIALEWTRGRTTMGPSSSPYVGLRCPRTGTLGVTLRESSRLREKRVARKETTGPWWIGYAFVHPDAGFPASTAEYRDRLIEGLRSAWNDYAKLVDEVLSASQ